MIFYFAELVITIGMPTKKVKIEIDTYFHIHVCVFFCHTFL